MDDASARDERSGRVEAGLSAATGDARGALSVPRAPGPSAPGLVHLLLLELARKSRALDETDRRLRTIIERHPGAIIIFDSQGIVRFVNPAAEALLGRDADEIVDYMLGFPLEGGPIEFSIVQPGQSRETRVAEMRLVEIEWQGEPGYLASLHDISERKRAEEAERRHLELKEEFVANVSHELRTPLQSIKGFVELLHAGMVDDPAVEEEFLERIAGDVDRLTALVNDLLDISRFQAGHVELDREELDADALAREAVGRLKSVAHDQDVPLSYVTAEASSTVYGDRRRLEQVLTNLIGNAIKFSDAGSPVRVSVSREEVDVAIAVTDEGPGIPPEDLENLFVRFYRGRGARRQGGTGLGLYISKEIIDAHDGQIDVESQVGRGSTFTVRLPRPEVEE